VEKLKEIQEVGVKITFDPPWDFSKVSDAAKEKLGII
jgi:metal-sulfur cluster biosynthetic enzyme